MIELALQPMNGFLTLAQRTGPQNPGPDVTWGMRSLYRSAAGLVCSPEQLAQAAYLAVYCAIQQAPDCEMAPL